MNTPTIQQASPYSGISPTGQNYWYDPAVAKLNPADPDSKWTCSVRGPNGGVIAWAEGDDPEQTRARTASICFALNNCAALTFEDRRLVGAAPELLAALKHLETAATKFTVGCNCQTAGADDALSASLDIARAAIRKATGADSNDERPDVSMTEDR